MSEEANLLKRCKKGDERAIRQLVDTHQAAIGKTIVAIVGDPEHSKDVGQDVFIKFLSNLEQFEERSSVRTYLTRMAINQSLDVLKKKKPLVADLETAEEPLQQNWSFSNAYEEADFVQHALSRLGNDARVVLVLKEIQGYALEEIAGLLDIPIGTVASRLVRAKLKLSKILTALKNEGAIK